MIWLLGLVLFVQSFFFWIVRPGMHFLTPIVQFNGLIWIVFLVTVWLFSGKKKIEL